MSQPQIRVMISDEDFRHLVAGGELRVVTDEGTVCICMSDIGFDRMDKIVYHAKWYGDNRVGKVLERQAR